MLKNRIDLFELTAISTAEYLRGVWPDELADVSFDVAAYSIDTVDDGVERWRVDRDQRRIVLFRLPIQRLSRLHRNDELHQRMVVESSVFRAVAEFLGKDPWDITPDRFRRF